MEPQQQQEEQQLPPPMAAHLPGGPDEDFFRFRIDGTDILEDMEHQLRGEAYDEKSEKYIPKFDRWMNDNGINKVLHIIYSCGINKNTFLGNLEKDEIKYKCKTIKKKVARLFFNKYGTYGIKKEMRDLLVTSIVNTIHSGLSRSEGGRESDQISTAAQRYEVFQHQAQQEKSRGIVERLPFFGGRR